MPFRIRRAALASAGAAFLCGWALGERGELGPVQLVFLITIPVTGVILALWSRSRLAVSIVSAAAFAGLLIGQQSWDRAFADCTANGDRVRLALDAFQKTHGRYPTHLEDLKMPDEPCRARMRGSILHYAHNDFGYRIWFTDDELRFEATNRSPMIEVR